MSASFRVFRLSELLIAKWDVDKLVEDIKAHNPLVEDTGKWLIKVSCLLNDKYIETKTVECEKDGDLGDLLAPAWRLLLRSAKDKAMTDVAMEVQFASDTWAKEESDYARAVTKVIDDKKAVGLVEFYEHNPGVSVISLNTGYLSS